MLPLHCAGRLPGPSGGIGSTTLQPAVPQCNQPGHAMYLGNHLLYFAGLVNAVPLLHGGVDTLFPGRGTESDLHPRHVHSNVDITR
ncbi:hypothetical protein VTK56DRAFT_8672 [Thermocarpiscus australiensis]